MNYAPVSVHTFVTCRGCGRVASTRFTKVRHGDLQLELPQGWDWGPETPDPESDPNALFCSLSCCFDGGYENRTPNPGTFDPSTVSKIFELLDASAGASPDAVLSAMEAVLIAWRKGQAAT